MIVFTVAGLIAVLIVGYGFMPRTSLVVSLTILACYLQPLIFDSYSDWPLLWVPIVVGGFGAVLWDKYRIEKWLKARQKVKEEKAKKGE